MGAKLLALLIASLAGVTMAFQGTINSALGKVVGLVEATFIVHAVGMALAGLLLCVPLYGATGLAKVGEAPWYTYLGGILGVLIIYAVVRSIPRVGVAPATTAIVLGQVLTAAMIDHLGLFGMQKLPFTWYRLVGAALMAAGAWLMLKGGE